MTESKNKEWESKPYKGAYKEEVYSDPEKLSEANRHYQQLSPRLIKAQAEWERMAEEIMELEGN